MERLIEDLAGDWRRLDERIEGLSDEIEALARRDVGCGRLMSVPGIGPIISSAMVAAIGTGDAFSKGRDFAACWGLCRGRYRPGIAHVARYRSAVIAICGFCSCRLHGWSSQKSWERHGLKSWIEAAKKRLHHNVLAIALANKLARIAWSVLAHSRAFEASATQPA
jgi:transposase